jgi:hypothetical protein
MAYLALNWDQNEVLSFFFLIIFSRRRFFPWSKNPHWKKGAVKKYLGPQAWEGISEKSQGGYLFEVY